MEKYDRRNEVACGRKLTKEEMKEIGTLTLRCTANEYIVILCPECKKKSKYSQNLNNTTEKE